MKKTLLNLWYRITGKKKYYVGTVKPGESIKLPDRIFKDLIK